MATTAAPARLVQRAARAAAETFGVMVLDYHMAGRDGLALPTNTPQDCAAQLLAAEV